VEWLNFDPRNELRYGHLAAMGYMNSEIDVWDLNVSGCLEPVFRLGGKTVKKSNRHTEAVLDLSWNIQTRLGLHTNFLSCLCFVACLLRD
jgi:periodic tryptophan protein 1